MECFASGGGDHGFTFAALTPRRMVEEQFVPGSVVTSLAGETDVAGGPPDHAGRFSVGPL